MKKKEMEEEQAAIDGIMGDMDEYAYKQLQPTLKVEVCLPEKEEMVEEEEDFETYLEKRKK